MSRPYEKPFWTADSILPLHIAHDFFRNHLGMKDVKQSISYLGGDPLNFWFRRDTRTVCYWDGLYYADISTLDYRHWSSIAPQDKGLIGRGARHFAHLRRRERCTELFKAINPKIVFAQFQHLMKHIPATQLYECFALAHIRSAFDNHIPPEQLADIFAHQDLARRRNAQHQVVSANQGWVTLYRGAESKASPISDAYAWALSPSIAVDALFGKALDGRLYQARIRKEKIIDVLSERHGYDVLVLPSDVQDIRELPLLSQREVQVKLRQFRAHHRAEVFEALLERPDLFLAPHGPFGIRHTRRIIRLALALGSLISLPQDDQTLLLLAATYYEIGRPVGEVGIAHGEASFQRALQHGLFAHLSPTESELIHHLMAAHDMPSGTSWTDTTQWPQAQYERVGHLLPILQDAKTLDSLRSSERHTQWLRLPKSYQLARYAAFLLGKDGIVPQGATIHYPPFAPAPIALAQESLRRAIINRYDRDIFSERKKERLMTTGSLFKRINDALWHDTVLPIAVLANEEARRPYDEMYHQGLSSWEEVQEAMRYLERDPQHFFFAPHALAPFCYWHGPVFVDFPNLLADTLRDLEYKKRIDIQEEAYAQWRAEKKFATLFAHIDTRVAFQVFWDLWDEIPQAERYSLFRDLYVGADYGFERLTPTWMERVFAEQDPLARQEAQAAVQADPSGLVTLYRGVGNQSRPPEESYSWTTSLEMATFFATRFSQAGKIYEAWVRKDRIIDFMEVEQEVWVRPADLENLHEAQLMGADDVIPDLENEGLIDLYHRYARLVEKEGLFQHPDGIHGVRHAKRVLLLAITLAHYEFLPEQDWTPLLLAAVYHDIGRTHDREDEAHGILSWEKAQHLKLFARYHGEDLNIVRFLMETHCMDDETAKRRVTKKTYGLRSQAARERALRLFSFMKDADGLDRVRLKDLDLRYMRLAISPRLIRLAWEYLHNVQ